MTILKTHTDNGRILCFQWGCAEVAVRKAVITLIPNYFGTTVMPSGDQHCCAAHTPVIYAGQEFRWDEGFGA